MNDKEHIAFTRQWTRVQSVLISYLSCHVQDGNVVDDLLQETACALVHSYHRFDQDRSFLAWALGAAKNRMLRHFRDQKRKPGILLDPQVMDSIADAHLELADELNRRGHALRQCIEQLDDKHRQLLERRFVQLASYDDLADAYGRGTGCIYGMVSRLRTKLRRCVQGKMGVP